MPTTEAVPATVWSALTGPWHDGTVVRAFAEVGLIGAVGGVLGCWIVLYGLSYGGGAPAPPMFPGPGGGAPPGLPPLPRRAARRAAPALVDTRLLLLIAAAILVAVQGLGNLLVVAVLIAPAATARLLVRRMAPMMALAAGLAVLAGAAGLYLSYYARTAGGASIAGMMVAFYLVALAATSLRPRIVSGHA